MAKRKQLFHTDEVKKKIQTSQLINRLTQNAISDEEIMTPSQVTSANILLKKVLPDLKAIEHASDADNPLTFVQKIELVSPDDDSSTSDTE